MSEHKTPIEVGSVVQLRSGGEWMTVEEIVGNAAKVVWMDQKKNVQREALPIALLLNQADWTPFA